jgi:hypothetical protein
MTYKLYCTDLEGLAKNGKATHFDITDVDMRGHWIYIRDIDPSEIELTKEHQEAALHLMLSKYNDREAELMGKLAEVRQAKKELLAIEYKEE